MDIEKLQIWLTALISGLVSYPDEIKIEQKSDEVGILFVVRVNKEDCGKVIGKEGSIADALRVLTRSAGRLLDIRTCLKIDAGTNYEVRKEVR